MRRGRRGKKKRKQITLHQLLPCTTYGGGRGLEFSRKSCADERRRGKGKKERSAPYRSLFFDFSPGTRGQCSYLGTGRKRGRKKKKGKKKKAHSAPRESTGSRRSFPAPCPATARMESQRWGGKKKKAMNRPSVDQGKGGKRGGKKGPIHHSVG